MAAVRKKLEDGKPIASNDEIREFAEDLFKMAKVGKISVDDEEETNSEAKKDTADDIDEVDTEPAIKDKKEKEENSATKVAEKEIVKIFEEEPDENVASHLATMVANEAVGLEPNEDLPF